ncbi:CsbD family protein [Streptomyces roseoverticillatus]|uniref:CsbD family protein n=1 Tax=Streptomyces roseoverticillatus TaxID=66429 RepID=A0ABV3IY72_9ACTN
MSGGKKAKHAAEKIKGKAEETAGSVTGDDAKRARGKAEQAKADAKLAGEHARNALRH